MAHAFLRVESNIRLDSESSLVADSGKDADTQYILINFTDANLKTAKLSVHGREAKKRACRKRRECAKENRSPDNRLFCWHSLGPLTTDMT